jgi:hypothetical protein
MLADVAQRCRAQQGIAQCVQQDIAIGMRKQTELVRDPYPAQGNEIAFSETVHIIAVANTHKKRPEKVRA